jgi:hypothetical protein
MAHFPCFATAAHQRNTRIGKELSGALVATLAGMALANCGYLPAPASAAHAGPAEVGAVFKFLLPLAIPMLLLSADLRRIIGWAHACASSPWAARERWSAGAAVERGRGGRPRCHWALADDIGPP